MNLQAMLYFYYTIAQQNIMTANSCLATLALQKELQRSNSANQHLNNYQAHIHNQSGLDKTILLFEGLNKKAPKSYHILWRLCEAYEQVGNYQKSSKYFSKLIKMNPKNRWHYNRRLKFLIKIGKYKQALRLSLKAPQNDEDQQQFYLQFGFQLLKKCKFDSAIQSFKVVLQRNRNNEKALYALARAHFFNDQIRYAIQCIQACIFLNIGKFQYDAMRQMLIITKNLQEDRPIQFNQKIDDGSCNYTCFFYIAEIFYLKKDFRKARDYFMKYRIQDCQFKYEKTHTLDRLADCLRMTKEYELANYYLQQLKTIFPSMARYCNLRIGINLVDLKKLKKAQQLLVFCQQQMKKTRSNYYFRLYFGLCLKLERYQQCADKYQLYQTRFQNLPRIHINIIYGVSTSYMQLGMQLKAKEFLKIIFESKYESLTKSLTEDNFCQLVKYYIMNNLVDQAKDLLFTVKRMCENWENFYRSRYIKQTRKCILEIEKSLPK